MCTISFHVSEEEARLIKDYVTAYCLNICEFVKDTILEKIEEEISMDEQRILSAREKSKFENKYEHSEVWKKLGI